MRLWLRMLILTLAVSLGGIAVTGFVALRSGYRAILDSGIDTLKREATVVGSLMASRYADLGIDAAVSEPGAAQIASLARDWAETLDASGFDAEVRTDDGQEFRTRESPYADLDAAGRSELSRASKGEAAWILRRIDGSLTLCLSAPAGAFGRRVVVSLAMDMGALDSYVAVQSRALLAVALGALFLLPLALYAGGRLVTRRLVALTRQASALAAGALQARAEVRGRDEVAVLSRSFNDMASSIAQAMEKLRAETEARQAFIDGLTHELRTPVTSIVGFAEHLERCTYDPAVFARGLRRIRTEGLRILRLSDDLTKLLLARTREPAPPPVRLVDLLSRTAEEARERWPDHRIAVLVEPESACLAVEPVLLETVLRNLVDNAAAASPAGSRIDVGWRDEGDGGSLSVRDRGPGIGSRAEEGAASPRRRLGIGLSICRQIAARLGADLALEGHPDGGTVACMRFPNSHRVHGTVTAS